MLLGDKQDTCRLQLERQLHNVDILWSSCILQATSTLIFVQEVPLTALLIDLMCKSDIIYHT